MTKHLKRGPFRVGDKVQLTGPKGRINTITLVEGAAFGTHRGDLKHDEIIGKPDGQWGALFEMLAQNVADAPPVRPKPLTQDGLLGLFASETVGRDVVLQPATAEDMCGGVITQKPSLEVVYDTV